MVTDNLRIDERTIGNCILAWGNSLTIIRPASCVLKNVHVCAFMARKFMSIVDCTAHTQIPSPVPPNARPNFRSQAERPVSLSTLRVDVHGFAIFDPHRLGLSRTAHQHTLNHLCPLPSSTGDLILTLFAPRGSVSVQLPNGDVGGSMFQLCG